MSASKTTPEPKTGHPAEAGPPALLPPGISDLLPPEATIEAETMERLIALFELRGFGRVKAPLIEFEESLFAGPGAALADNTFRLMDPVSRQMLGLRSDMTMQVARIAASRLKKAPRPLRLCYGGQVLRVQASQIRNARQFAQVGAEIIGSESPMADAEAATAAWEGLSRLGVESLSIDLTLPTLVATLCREAGLEEAALAELRLALGRKDPTAVRDLGSILGEPTTEAVIGLLEATGPAEAALARIAGLTFGPEARDLIASAKEIVDRLGEATDNLTITIDPIEYRGFEYHAGVAFSFFAGSVQGELGRGGRYQTPDGEAATGFTLFMDTIRRALPDPGSINKVFLPKGTPVQAGQALRQEGWITVEGLEPADNPSHEAVRQHCSHIFSDGRPKPVA